MPMETLTLRVDVEDAARLRQHAARLAKDTRLRALMGAEVTLNAVARLALHEGLDRMDLEDPHRSRSVPPPAATVEVVVDAAAESEDTGDHNAGHEPQEV